MSSPYSNLERPGLNLGVLRTALCMPSGPYARLEILPRTGSTNTDLVQHAQREAAGWPDLSVLGTELQTAGRGRRDRVWEAPERSSLFVSVLLRPFNRAGRPVPTTAYTWFSLLAALALAESIEDRTEIAPRLKWPNDVTVDGRKLAGILAQVVPGAGAEPPAVVVGVGLNVSLTEDELPVPTATSLLLEYAGTTDRNVLLKSFLRTFADRYRAFCDVDGDVDAPQDAGPSLRARVEQRMATLGEDVRAQLPDGSVLTGRALGLDPQGALVVRDDDGERTVVSAADVLHLRPRA